MNLADEIPDAPVAAFGPRERNLIWCFRKLATGPQCLSRLAVGLSSLVAPAESVAAAEAIRDVFYGVNWESARRLGIMLAPARNLSWDEAALLLLFAAARADYDAIGLWMRRLGVSDPSSTLRAHLDRAASILARSNALPDMKDLAALGPQRRVCEPEVAERAVNAGRAE